MTDQKLFADISHWQGDIPVVLLMDLGHDLVIIKASDGYYMPNKQGQYTSFTEDDHVDAWFVDNVMKAAQLDMLWAPYHFVRFTNAYNNKFSRDILLEKNLEYLMGALTKLPEELQGVQTVVLDIEQDISELFDRGITSAFVSDFVIDLVNLYLLYFKNVIIYSGSWWTSQMLDNQTLESLATKVSMWEAEYRSNRLIYEGGNCIGYENSYIPTLPHGFKPEFATNIQDLNGRLFAHQFTDDAHIKGYTGDLDFNITHLSSEAINSLFSLMVEEEEPPMIELRKLEEILETISETHTIMAYSMHTIAKQLEIFINKMSGMPPIEEEEPIEEEPVDVEAWLEQYSWRTNQILQEWSDPWEGNLPSDKKVLYSLTEGTAPVRLMIPQRNKSDFKIQRNKKGGIIWSGAMGPTQQDPPKFTIETWPEGGIWGFKEPLAAGTESDSGDVIVLIGDLGVPGHEFYVINPFYVTVKR